MSKADRVSILIAIPFAIFFWIIAPILFLMGLPVHGQQAPPAPAVATSATQPISGTVSIGNQPTVNQGTPAAIANAWPTGVQPYPNGATPVQAFATGTTAATVATLPATSGKTTYICGFADTANATAAATGGGSITGIGTVIGWVQNIGANPAVGTFQQTFTPCIPANATNTTIVITGPAAGTGGTQDVYAWGFEQ
jgi:hypothetical protein